MGSPREPKYHGLPSRYEDTKPALEQVFTHGRIIDLGGRVLEKYNENVRVQREKALQENEKALWRDAEKYKDECVKEALNQAKKSEDERTYDLLKKHSDFVKFEVSRTEGIWRQKCIEAAYDERVAGEKNMKDVTAELRKRFNLEKMAEVEATEIKERGIAQAAAEEAQRRFDLEKHMLVEELDIKRHNELQEQAAKFEVDMAVGISETVVKEQEKALQHLEEVNAIHRQDVDHLLERIKEITQDKNNLETQLDAMTVQRDDFIRRYEEIRDQFTEFIEQSRPDFSNGQADFLLPPKATL